MKVINRTTLEMVIFNPMPNANLLQYALTVDTGFIMPTVQGGF